MELLVTVILFGIPINSNYRLIILFDCSLKTSIKDIDANMRGLKGGGMKRERRGQL